MSIKKRFDKWWQHQKDEFAIGFGKQMMAQQELMEDIGEMAQNGKSKIFRKRDK